MSFGKWVKRLGQKASKVVKVAGRVGKTALSLTPLGSLLPQGGGGGGGYQDDSPRSVAAKQMKRQAGIGQISTMHQPEE